MTEREFIEWVVANNGVFPHIISVSITVVGGGRLIDVPVPHKETYYYIEDESLEFVADKATGAIFFPYRRLCSEYGEASPQLVVTKDLYGEFEIKVGKPQEWVSMLAFLESIDDHSKLPEMIIAKESGGSALYKERGGRFEKMLQYKGDNEGDLLGCYYEPDGTRRYKVLADMLKTEIKPILFTEKDN